MVIFLYDLALFALRINKASIVLATYLDAPTSLTRLIFRLKVAGILCLLGDESIVFIVFL